MMKEFWDRYGKVITVGVSIVGAVGSALLVAGLSAGRVLNKVENLSEKQIEITRALETLETGPLATLDKKLDEVEGSLALLTNDRSASVTVDRIKALEESLLALRQTQDSLHTQLAEVRPKLEELGRVRTGVESLVEGQGRLQRDSLQEHREIERTIASLRADVERLNGVLEIIKPLVTEGLAIGRISMDDVRKVYSEEEIRQFLEDAESLFRKPGTGGGGGGGGGGYGGFDRMAHGTLSQFGECSGPPRNCLSVALRDQGDTRHQQITIELFYGLSRTESIAVLSTGSSKKILLAEARNYPGPLCEWVGSKLYDPEAS